MTDHWNKTVEELAEKIAGLERENTELRVKIDKLNKEFVDTVHDTCAENINGRLEAEAKLTKYEKVVEAAREWLRAYEAIPGISVIQFMEIVQKLIAALRALEKGENSANQKPME